MEEFDPRSLLRGDVPTIYEIDLLPEGHEMLSRKMGHFDFETDPRDPYAIRDLLIAAMLNYGGSGLAANQIGVECRAFAMMLFNQPLVFFNPVITELSMDTIFLYESCLTFPHLRLNIARPGTCRVIYTDPDGNRQSVTLAGREARIAIHETDHLNGVVMIQKVSRIRLKLARRKASKRFAT